MGVVVGGIFPCPRGGGNMAVFQAVQRSEKDWDLHYRCDWCKREFVVQRSQLQKSVRLLPHAKKTQVEAC